jgi:2-dehydropantoate 2-reductase
MNNQTIYIIGAGAIGKALAVFLKLGGKNVTLIRGSIDDQSVKNEKIEVELSDKTVLVSLVEVNTLSNFNQLNGIIVLTNKSFGNATISHALKGKTGTSPIVVMQNGLGVEQPFIDNDFPEIYRCVLFATSQAISNHALRFKPVAISPIGTIKGSGSHLASIVDQLDNPNFHFKAVADIQTIIWKKAIANSVFNSVCPLLEIDNGIFHRSEAALAIAKRVIHECVGIAKEAGISIGAQEVVESLLLISESSDGQLISTLQDIRNKRKTEIETLNFSIVAIAKKLGMEAMVAETKLLGELTKLKSELTQQHQ